MKDLKQLISLDGDGNRAWFLRGNDGDMHIVMSTSDDLVEERHKGCMHSVRVGVGNSGGQQDIPLYVKKALGNLVDAFEMWHNEDSGDNLDNLLKELQTNS